MKYIKKFSLFLFCILLLSYSILQISSVKQFIVGKSIEFVNSNADFKISYEKFSCQNFKNIHFNDITINNKSDNEELLKIQQLQVSLNLFNLFLKRELDFQNLDFVDLVLLINKNSSLNFQVGKGYFNSFGIRVENINLSNCSVVFNSDDFKKDEKKIFDINHFRINKINSQLKNVILSRRGISADIKKFSAACNEILLKNLELQADYHDNKIKLGKVFIDSNYGRLSGNIEACNLSNKENLNYDLDLKNLTIDSEKIPQLKKFSSEIFLEGKIKGGLHDIFIQKGRCFYKKNFVSFSGFIKNFDDVEKLQYEINKVSGKFNFLAFRDIIPDKFIKITPFTEGNFNGSIQGISRKGNFVLDIQTQEGDINSNFSFDNVFSQNLNFNGEISLQKINLQNFGLTNINSVHIINFSREGKKLENKISELTYNNVNVRDIKCTLHNEGKNYVGFLKIDDQNIKTSLDFKNYDSVIYCLGHCNLQNLNRFFKSEKKVNIQNDINIKVKTNTSDINAIFSNNCLKIGKKDIGIKFLKAEFQHENKFSQLNVFSDFLDIKVYDIPKNLENTKKIFLQFLKNLYSWTENRELKISRDPDFKIPFYINLKVDSLFNLFSQNINCGNTNIYGDFLNINGKKIFNINVDKIKSVKIGDKELTNTDLYFTIGLNEKKKLPILNVLCEVDEINTKKVCFNDIAFKIDSQDGTLNTNLGLKNRFFNFTLNLKSFFKDGQIIFDLKDDDSYCKLNKWDLIKDGRITIARNNISIENLTLRKNQMHFVCDYNLSLEGKKWKNKFLLQIKDIKIENWEKYTQFKMGGTLNGSIKKDNSPFFDINFVLDDLQINKNDLGNINTRTKYNINNKVYDYTLSIKKGERITLDVNGFFNDENKKINTRCFFNDFDLKIFEIISYPICDKLSGLLKGTLSIFGTFEQPKFWGDIDLINGDVLFAPIKSRFRANGHLKGDIDGLDIMNLEVKDDEGGDALLDGRIKINFHKFPVLDLPGKANNIHILHTEEKDNSIVYGDLFCSGDVHFFGPLNFLTISGNLQSEKKSKIFFNFENEINTDYSFIHFVENEDTTVKGEKKIDKYVYNGVKLDLSATLNQDLQAFFKIPYSNIEIQGNGNLHIVTTFNEDWDIKGAINIEKGDYLFSLKDFIKKKFKIETGGILNFLGDIDQTTLSIIATENVTLSNSKNENYVILKIITSGLIKDPDIKYDIDLSKSSDIEPSIKSKIKINEDMRNNYFLNLLLFRNFEINSSNISNDVLNFFNMTIKKSDDKNKFQINLNNEQFLSKNLSNLDLVYNFKNKFQISKKQKISNKQLNFKDIQEDLEIKYQINNNLKMYSNIGKNETFKLGFKFSN